MIVTLNTLPNSPIGGILIQHVRRLDNCIINQSTLSACHTRLSGLWYYVAIHINLLIKENL